MNMTIKPLYALLILILIVAIPLFAHLDSFPLDEWDESHLANNALEMSHNHNWLVTTYNNTPDMWETKPPLMIWLQVISMKVLGENELAIRLPSALAALTTCFLLFFFFTKKYNEPWLGIISVATLVTAEGYLHLHNARSGDYDSLLTMLMTAYAIFYFLYLEENRKKYLYTTIAFLILAALTKGIQGLMFLPGLFVYTIYKKKFISILKVREIYQGIAAFLFFVLGYYLLREHYNPGYLAAVKVNELQRYNTVIESHQGDKFYYIFWLSDHFRYAYLFAIPGVICGICSSNKGIKDITVFITLLTGLYLLTISNSQTKVFWYLMPVFPFLAVLAAIFIYSICLVLKDTDRLKGTFQYNPFPFIFLLFLFCAPFSAMKDLAYEGPKGFGGTDEIKNMEIFLQDVLHNRRNINGFSIVNPGTEQHLGWYYKPEFGLSSY